MNSSLLDQLHSLVASPAFIHVAKELTPVVTVGTAAGWVVLGLWRATRPVRRWVARLLRRGTGKHHK
ncbi:hypothetical protein ABT119_35045 [Streptomyces sp. NPDC001910]|uniref:hypothetical protein n=1 Tax=Streptomyces sp. NPDC001910 TaxID=3154403 RepID=UPI003332D4AB